ncbi:MAG TPA: GNAT family N-acetyltransferase [Leptolyngbya sp.]|jgi:predicted GNAT family N-acyltransferase|nr:GNAT family N-acetyltransferase [Leptolyngbya sp.]
MTLDQSPIHALIKVAQFDRDFEQIAAIRASVFQIEQGVDPALEFDGQDEAATHFLAYKGESAIGTARIRFLSDQTAKLERLAVLPNFRKDGVGRKIVETVLEFLANKNIADLRIHAQIPVVAFYQKLGFVAEGETFEEAGIPHIKMRYKFPQF